MGLIFSFARAYPRRSALTLLAVVAAGLTEGFSLGLVLPMLTSLDAARRGVLAAEQAPSQAPSQAAEFGDQMLGLLASVGIPPTFAALLTLILAGLGLKSTLSLVASRQVAYTVAHVATDLRLSLLRAFLSTRWEYFIRRPIGGLANTVGAEAMQSAIAYQHGANAVAFAFQALVYSAVMLLMDWRVAVAALGGGLVVTIILSILVRTARRAGDDQAVHMKSLISRLADNLQSIKPLKSMGRENLADLLLTRDTNLLNDALRRQVFGREALRSLQEPLITVILLLGIFAAIRFWDVPLATVTVLALLLSKLMVRIGKIQRFYQEAVTCEGAYRSLKRELEGSLTASEGEFGSTPPTLISGIHVAGLDFSYEEKVIFSDISLTIPAGKWTSIVGASGVGKTTLIDLITGLLRPQRGRIEVDGMPLSELHLSSWRRMIGYVPQETLLLHDSIATNVTLGDTSLKSQDVERALRAAGAWGFVSKLPDGAESSVGERGSLLSGGQRQRIALARALVHRPGLLILDEATSALDPTMEAEICETLQGLLGDVTILAISHQAGLVAEAQVVYKVENHKVICTRGDERAISPGA